MPRSKFGWCAARQHKICRRALTSISGVHKDKLMMCGCDEDGCPCAVMNHHFPEEVPQESVQASETVVQ